MRFPRSIYNAFSSFDFLFASYSIDNNAYDKSKCEAEVRHLSIFLYLSSCIVLLPSFSCRPMSSLVLLDSVVDKELFIPYPDPSSEKFRIRIRTVFSKNFHIKNFVQNFALPF